MRLLLPIPVALILIVLFFMPWLGLSCDAGQVARQMHMRPIRNVPAKDGFVACASGYQLAEGLITLTQPTMDGKEVLAEHNALLKARPWLYLCLLGPVLIAAIAAMSLAGAIRPNPAGKAIQALGVIGLVAVLSVSSFDYVADAANIYRANAGSQLADDGADSPVRSMEANLQEIVHTRATVYLWYSAGLYGLVIVTGLAACGVSTKHGWTPTAGDDLLEGQRPRLPGVIAQGPADFGPELNPAWTEQRTRE